MLPENKTVLVDQVQKLTKAGTRATFLGTAQKDNVIQQIQYGEHYHPTPESLYERVTRKPRLKLAVERIGSS